MISDMITVGNVSTMKDEKVERLRSYVLQCDGSKFEITPENVKVIPDLWINLFGINKNSVE
jgi:hypothetical protein